MPWGRPTGQDTEAKGRRSGRQLLVHHNLNRTRWNGLDAAGQDELPRMDTMIVDPRALDDGGIEVAPRVVDEGNVGL